MVICSENCRAGLGKGEYADEKWHALDCPNHTSACCSGSLGVTHEVTIQRTGAVCSCGEFNKITVTTTEAARAAHRHASRFPGDSTVKDLRLDDPTGELKLKKARQRNRGHTNIFTP